MRTQLVGSIVLLMASAIAHAADDPPSLKALPVEDVMSNLDRNQNGCIEQEEGRNYASRRFHSLDANGDGQLDVAEAPPAAGDTQAMRPISVEAWQDAYQDRFNAIDGDANGCLTPQEISDGRARRDSTKKEG